MAYGAWCSSSSSCTVNRRSFNSLLIFANWFFEDFSTCKMGNLPVNRGANTIAHARGTNVLNMADSLDETVVGTQQSPPLALLLLHGEKFGGAWKFSDVGILWSRRK